MINPSKVIFITVDSLRKDRVTREVMPYLSGLKDEGIWFENMMSCAPATMASFKSIMTGRYPSEIEGLGIPDGVNTLGDNLPNKYQTIGYTTNNLTGSHYGYDSGFDYFASPSSISSGNNKLTEYIKKNEYIFEFAKSVQDYLLNVGSSTRYERAGSVNQKISNVSKEKDDPQFIWVHYMDPHAPYEPPEEYLPNSVSDRDEILSVMETASNKQEKVPQKTIDKLTSLYDGECKYWDDQFKRFHQEIADGDTLTVVLADHGDLLGEHDRFGHLHEMWDELVNIPMIIHHPSLGSKVVKEQYSAIDIPETVLDIIGGELLNTMSESIDFESDSGRELTFGSIQSPSNVGYVQSAQYKWVYHNSNRPNDHSDGELLFNRDDNEDIEIGKKNLKQHRSTVKRLKNVYENAIANNSNQFSGESWEDEKVKQHMRDLGYIE